MLAQFNFAQLIVDREPGENGMAKAVVLLRAGGQGRACRRAICDGADPRQRRPAARKRDEAEARRWLELAARQDFDTAELDLGTWLVEGRGGPKDRKAGFRWLRRAAPAATSRRRTASPSSTCRGIGAEPDDRRRRLVHPRPARRAQRSRDGRSAQRPHRRGNEEGDGEGQPAALAAAATASAGILASIPCLSCRFVVLEAPKPPVGVQTLPE